MQIGFGLLLPTSHKVSQPFFMVISSYSRWEGANLLVVAKLLRCTISIKFLEALEDNSSIGDNTRLTDKFALPKIMASVATN